MYSNIIYVPTNHNSWQSRPHLPVPCRPSQELSLNYEKKIVKRTALWWLGVGQRCVWEPNKHIWKPQLEMFYFNAK